MEQYLLGVMEERMQPAILLLHRLALSWDKIKLRIRPSLVCLVPSVKTSRLLWCQPGRLLEALLCLVVDLLRVFLVRWLNSR
jgi:hypothetical protein